MYVYQFTWAEDYAKRLKSSIEGTLKSADASIVAMSQQLEETMLLMQSHTDYINNIEKIYKDEQMENEAAETVMSFKQKEIVGHARYSVNQDIIKSRLILI